VVDRAVTVCGASGVWNSFRWRVVIEGYSSRWRATRPMQSFRSLPLLSLQVVEACRSRPAGSGFRGRGLGIGARSAL
jgi:hypothetical protein